MSEVQGREVDKVDYEKHFSPGKAGAHEEPHESKVEEVVDDEVASNTGGSMGGFGVVGEETSDVTELENK